MTTQDAIARLDEFVTFLENERGDYGEGDWFTVLIGAKIPGDLREALSALHQQETNATDEEMVPHAFNSRTPHEPGDDRDIWCKDCEYHRDHQIDSVPPLAPSERVAQAKAEFMRWVGDRDFSDRELEHALNVLISAVSQAQDVRIAWQPMESAPKDRRFILLHVPAELGGYEVQIGSYDDDYAAEKPEPFWRYEGCSTTHSSYSRAHQPTHWMPLPAPPSDPTP